MAQETKSRLVSLCIVSYNQESFIREAVQSAFAQTYQPLEIIISDDCSSDRTFEIIKDEVSKYGGPHHLIVHQTGRNAGLANNLNETWNLARGEFIVLQAGDDVSLPQRVELMMEAWQHPMPVDLVVSDVIVIDKNGNELRRGWPDPIAFPLSLDEAVNKGTCYVLGCAVGYGKDLITTFGTMNEGVIQEDWVISFRALTRRGIRILKEPLLKYRQHDHNVWFSQKRTQVRLTRDQAKRFALNRLAIHQDWIKAWECSGQPENLNRQRLGELERQWQYELACYNQGRVGGLYLAFKGFMEGLSFRNMLGLIKRHVFRFSDDEAKLSLG